MSPINTLSMFLHVPSGVLEQPIATTEPSHPPVPIPPSLFSIAAAHVSLWEWRVRGLEITRTISSSPNVPNVHKPVFFLLIEQGISVASETLSKTRTFTRNTSATRYNYFIFCSLPVMPQYVIHGREYSNWLVDPDKSSKE